MMGELNEVRGYIWNQEVEVGNKISFSVAYAFISVAVTLKSVPESTIPVHVITKSNKVSPQTQVRQVRLGLVMIVCFEVHSIIFCLGIQLSWRTARQA